MVEDMPAIRYNYGSLTDSIVSSWSPCIVHTVELVPKPGGVRSFARCVGFICTGGARFLPNAKLGKIVAHATSVDDGNKNSKWAAVPDGEYVYCAVINRSPPGMDAHYECYVLVDDFGWPILTTKKRETETSCGPEAIPEAQHEAQWIRLFDTYGGPPK